MGKACGENCERLGGSIQEMTDQTKVEKLMVVSKMAGASGLLQLWTAIYPPLPIIGPSLICKHKVFTYIEYRTVSGVFRTIDPPPPPLPLASVSSPRTKGGGGGTHSPGVEGVGFNSSEDARHWIGLLQYNPSTYARLELHILILGRCLYGHPVVHSRTISIPNQF
jgi:hypothetical protein